MYNRSATSTITTSANKNSSKATASCVGNQINVDLPKQSNNNVNPQLITDDSDTLKLIVQNQVKIFTLLKNLENGLTAISRQYAELSANFGKSQEAVQQSNVVLQVQQKLSTHHIQTEFKPISNGDELKVFEKRIVEDLVYRQNLMEELAAKLGDGNKPNQACIDLANIIFDAGFWKLTCWTGIGKKGLKKIPFMMQENTMEFFRAIVRKCSRHTFSDAEFDEFFKKRPKNKIDDTENTNGRKRKSATKNRSSGLVYKKLKT